MCTPTHTINTKSSKEPINILSGEYSNRDSLWTAQFHPCWAFSLICGWLILQPWHFLGSTRWCIYQMVLSWEMTAWHAWQCAEQKLHLLGQLHLPCSCPWTWPTVRLLKNDHPSYSWDPCPSTRWKSSVYCTSYMTTDMSYTLPSDQLWWLLFLGGWSGRYV